MEKFKVTFDNSIEEYSVERRNEEDQQLGSYAIVRVRKGEGGDIEKEELARCNMHHNAMKLMRSYVARRLVYFVHIIEKMEKIH